MEERRRQYKAWHFKNQQEKRTARKKASADAARHYSLKSMYGLSRADIEAMHEQQDGRCAICRKRPPEGAVGHKRLAVDHNHETGKARGLLCFSCNTALGHLKDRLELVRAAVRYLEEYEECPIAS